MRDEGYSRANRLVPAATARATFMANGGRTRHTPRRRVWLHSKFVCPLGDRTYSPDEAFIRESEWVRREIHFDGFAI
jgi:hypothetical protein